MRRSLVGLALLTIGLWATPPARSGDAPRPDAPKTEAPAKTLREFAERLQGRFAYGLYIKDKKVGYLIEDYKLAQRDGKTVLLASSEEYFTVTVDGVKSVSEEKTATTYSVEGDGTVVHASVWAKEDGKVTTREAVRSDKGMTLTVKQNGRTDTRTLPVPLDSLARDRDFLTWLNDPARKKGDTAVKWSIDWSEDDVDRKQVCTFGARREETLGGVPLTLFDVVDETRGSRTKEETKGAKSKSVLMTSGKLFTGMASGVLTLKLEKESVARKIDGGDVDIIAATSVLVDTDLGPAHKVSKLVLEVSGLGDFHLPASHRQVFRPGKDGTPDVLELSRDFRVKAASPLTPDEVKANLKATVKLQADSPVLKELAAKIVGKEKDPAKQATLIVRWVYRNLKKSYSDNADNALAVLEIKAGDCTEHSILFVALARAAGLPAREVSGVAYVAGGRPMFGWHAWGEFHDGHQWVSVDPTWNQVYVDATHVKLGEGADDDSWVNLVGKLKFKVARVEEHESG